MRSQRSGTLHVFLTVTLVVVTVAAAVGFGYLIGNYAIRLVTSSGAPTRTALADQQSTSSVAPKTTASGDPTAQSQEAAAAQKAAAPAVKPTAEPAAKPATDPAAGTVRPTAQPGGNAAVKALDTSGVSSGGGDSLTRVLVGEFPSRAEASRVAEELKSKGYPVYVPGQPPYSVQVGAFRSAEAAQRLRSELLAQGYDASLR